MGYPTPKHFRKSGANFAEYIVQCAIRDRETFLEAITTGREPEPMRDEIDETEAELAAMHKRLRKG